MKPHIEQTIADLRGQMGRCQQAIDLITRIDALGENLAACLCPAVAGPGLAGPDDAYGLPAAEIRNPKAEIRRKSEGRNPNRNSVAATQPVRRNLGQGIAAAITPSRRAHGNVGKVCAYGKSIALLRACWLLPTDFTATAFIRAAQHEKKAARLVLWRWKAKGWISKIPGGYRRLSSFPAATAAESVPESGTPVPDNGADPKAPSSMGPSATETPVPDNGADPKVVLRKALEDALKVRDDHRAQGREKMAEIYQREADKLQAALGADS